MTGWQAIIFDLDDTLYPECDFVLGGFRAAAKWGEANLGIPSTLGFQELKILYERGARGDTFDRWLAEHAIQLPGVTERLVTVYRNHEPILAPYPGIRDLLNWLRPRTKLGLLSDGPIAVQQRKLTALGLIPFFSSIVFSDEWGRQAWKPNEVPYRESLKRLEVSGDRALYVADNPRKDFIGARLVGMSTLWFHTSSGVYSRETPPTSAHQSEREVHSVAEMQVYFSQAFLASTPGRLLHNDSV